MLIVAPDHFHMLADLVEQPALILPALAPAAEVVLEARLVLAAILVIVAVQVLNLTLPP